MTTITLTGVRRLAARAIIAAALLAGAAPAASAQDQPAEFESWRLPGWTFTPGVTFGTLWDSNVAVAFPKLAGEPTDSDRLWQMEPFGQLEYYGRRTDFSGGYHGFLRRYTSFNELDTFESRGSASFRQRVTRRLSLFANDNYLRAATTDFVELNGVPFLRMGSRYNSFAGGVENRLTRTTDMLVRYEQTWVSFDKKDAALAGGFVNGLHADVTHRFTDRSSFGGEYGVRWADLNQGTRLLTYQDVGAVYRYRTGERTTFEAAGGLAHLFDRSRDITRSGPYVRASLTHRAERATMGVDYSRSYVPSLAFGGTNQSQEARGYVQMPLSRNRLYVQESAAWRRTNPFTLEELPLDSIWIRTVVGYEIQRWFRVEGYHQLTRQDTRVEHGQINRQLVGVQVVVAQPMRIR